MDELSFRDVDIDRDDAIAEMSAIASQSVPLHFVLKWTRGKPVSLFALHGRIAGTNQWHSLIPHALNENDGEIVAPLGQHASGSTLELRFGVFALEDVPKIATFIARPGLVEQFSPLPPGRTQSIKRAETWRDGGLYKV